MIDVTTGKHHLELSVFPASPYYARVHVQRVLGPVRSLDHPRLVMLPSHSIVPHRRSPAR